MAVWQRLRASAQGSVLVLALSGCSNQGSAPASPPASPPVPAAASANPAPSPENGDDPDVFVDPFADMTPAELAAKRAERTASTCAATMTIRDLELIAWGESTPDIEATAHFRQTPLFEQAVQLGRGARDAAAAAGATGSSAGGEYTFQYEFEDYQVGVWYLPLYSGNQVPRPVFAFYLELANGQQIKIDLDEQTFQVFTGGKRRQKTSIANDSIEITDIVGLVIAKDIGMLEYKNLKETSFFTSPRDYPVLYEVQRRLLRRLQLKINGQLIYELAGIDHEFAVRANRDPEYPLRSTALVWRDDRAPSNPAFVEFLDEQAACN